jgi:hypothetical protein
MRKKGMRRSTTRARMLKARRKENIIGLAVQQAVARGQPLKSMMQREKTRSKR